MDYGTRVAWMLEEDDDEPLYLPADRNFNLPSARPTDARFSVSFLSIQPPPASDAGKLPPSASSALPSPHRSPRPAAASAAGSGMLVSTGSMVSRYEKVMRASFRPPAELRTGTAKQPQLGGSPRTSGDVSPQHNKPSFLSLQQAHTPPRATPPPRTASPTSASATPQPQQRGSPPRPSLACPMDDGPRDEEKQQVTFHSSTTPLHSSPLPIAAPVTDSKQAAPILTPEPVNASRPQLSVSTSNPKQSADKPKHRLPTPASSRWLREQERLRRKQDEKEAVWTERFLQEAAERQRLRVRQPLPPTQQPRAQLSHMQIHTTVPTAVESLMQTPATARTMPAPEQVAPISTLQPATMERRAASYQPSALRVDAAATQAERSSASEQSAPSEDVGAGSVEANERHEDRATADTWALIHRRPQPIADDVAALQRRSGTMNPETVPPTSVAVAHPGAGGSSARTEEQQLDMAEAWPQAQPHHPAACQLSPPAAAVDEQKQHQDEAAVVATPSSSSSGSSSGSATPTQLRSCLSGVERRRSSGGSASLRVRWVDWDAD